MLSLFAALIGCVVYEGNGVPATEERSVGDFSRVTSTTGVAVVVAEGESAASVTCDENLLPYILTAVEGDTLVVRLARSGTAFGVPAAVMIEPATECVAELWTPSLEAADCSGSGALSIEGDWEGLEELHSSGTGGIHAEGTVRAAELDLENSGAGPVRVAVAQAEELTLHASGSGPVEVESGSAELLDLDGSGTGALLASGLVAAEAEAHLSGAGDGEITVNGPLTANLSGSGDLHVWGTPTSRDVNASGSGDVIYED